MGMGMGMGMGMSQVAVSVCFIVSCFFLKAFSGFNGRFF
jgi:hypothetical protein